MDVETIYTSCACNRSPFAADWGCDDLLAYGAYKSVVICQLQSPARVLHTLIGHKDRVNSVQWITNNPHASDELVSGSTDKTAIVWKRIASKYECVGRLEGHSSTVTVVSGVYIATPEGLHTMVATASTDSTVKIWLRSNSEEFSCMQTITFGTGFALTLSWLLLPNTSVPMLACGGDDQKIHIFVQQEGQFVLVHNLLGHEDWVRGVDFTVNDEGDVLVASCSQDQYIRIWRMSRRDPDSLTDMVQDLTIDGDIRMKETTFTVTHNDLRLCYAVTLESVLQGHEGWVYSVRWQAPTVLDGKSHQPLCLLSASMDKTMILWQPDPDTGVWVDQVRVGDVGGNILGFYGGMFSPDGRSILAHGFHGAFHLWHQQQESKTWLPGVTVGGHYSSVEDVTWDPDGGEFIISVSLDQSTRLHGYWKDPGGTESSWHELGRPQIHGYDLQCLTMLDRWSFASGADEKVIRVFESPRNFIENISRLSGLDVGQVISDKRESSAPEGASVPALGLSNKAIFQDLAPPGDDRELNAGDNSQYSDFYFSPQTLHAPPAENNLLQNTLWPEIQKLYGHGYEIYSLAYHPRTHILASACKAAKTEHAAVLLWDTTSWRQVGQLVSHSLTITQLVFSHSGQYLLSVSRDRTWSLFKLHEGESKDCPYTRVAYTDKKTAVHTRIIWAAAWSPADKYFLTVSRDKKAVMWLGSTDRTSGSTTSTSGSTTSTLSSTTSSSSNSGVCGHTAYSSPLLLPDAITAVHFSPTLTPDGCYIVAFGLDSGSIYIYKWSDKLGTGPHFKPWTELAKLSHSEAHHGTVKRVQFRPVSGEVGTVTPSGQQSLQLASCGADHMVKIYTLLLPS